MSRQLDHSPVLLCEVREGVALLTLNRPERLNAFDAELGRAFDRAMVWMEYDPAVRVIVLTGAGRGFCAGADKGELRRLSSAPEALNARPPGASDPVLGLLATAPTELKSRFLLPAALSKPVIAAVNGACAGVGMALACYSDVRFVSEAAVFTAAFSRRGLVAEAGLGWLLPRLVGSAAATDLLLSGRRISAAEALKMGLASQIYADDSLLERALAYARDIAQNASPRSIKVIKRQVFAGFSQTLEDALRLGHTELQASLRSADFRESVAASLEARPPRFGAGQ